jgi:hypothetical protein
VRVRGNEGWLAAHVSVGVVFAAIQLSRGIADLWSDAMGLVGFPWSITCDPWDLVALPMLAVSWRCFPRAMTRPVRANLRRSAECAAAAGGLFACVATSPGVPGVAWDIEADVYFHNDNDFDVVVRLRTLSPTAVIDCDQAAEDPGRFLTAPMFGEIASWTVWPDANLPLRDGADERRECHAVMLEADSVEPMIVFWHTGVPAWTTVQGEGIDPAAPGFVSLSYDDDARGTYETGMDILFSAVPPSGRGDGVCTPQSDADRTVWSDEIPTGVWFLGEVEPGVDGCVAMDLRTGFEQQESLAGRQWYLCLPPGAFPFEAGQRVEILPDHAAAALAGEVSGLVMRELEVEANVATGLELVVSRGSGVASLFGMHAAFVPAFDCALQVEPTCGTLTRPGGLTLAGGGFATIEVGVGQSATTAAGDDDTQLEIHVGHAEERFAVQPDCAEGPDALGLDIELVAVRRGV